jgi:hypothetical protein
MDILYPTIKRGSLPAMLSVSLLGAVLAGIYGALHDQLSYSISEEYFTKVKFHQFSYADFGLHRRIFAAEVGFLASWWVGMIVAWFLARLGLTELPEPPRRACIVTAFSIVFLTAIVVGAGGLAIGVARTSSGDLRGWDEWQRALELTNLRGFVIVAHLHDASYLGGLLGLIAAAIYVRRNVKRCATSTL